MTLKFPNDLPEKYYTSIGFEEYSRPDPFNSLVKLTQVTDTGGLIALPIPQNIVDSQQLKWTERSALLGEFVGDTWDALTNKGDWGDVTKDLGLAALNLPSTIGGLGTRLFGSTGNAIATEASDVTKAILQKSGLAINPVLSQMFDTPEFKRHSFSWKFSPDTPEESQTVADIVEAFRFNALPDVAYGGMFFKYPSIVKIRLHTGDRDLYRFQPCVINAVEVNYASNQAQVPSFFSGTSMPTNITLKIDLVEIILNTRQNTKINGGTAFGLGSGSMLNNRLTTLLNNPSGLFKK